MNDTRRHETDLERRFLEAPTYEEYFGSARKLLELWEARDRRARLPGDVRRRLRELEGRRHLLALTYDGCGDGVDLLPWVARMAEATPELELRIVERDENPDLMDAHLTDRGSRSVPVVILLDEDFRELGWWGERALRLLFVYDADPGHHLPRHGSGFWVNPDAGRRVPHSPSGRIETNHGNPGVRPWRWGGAFRFDSTPIRE